ncbi:MAG: DUF1294 domain-containing protein [Muribaculaceae bacterium]|nr:DUF1294 domain-containing protein [Muribaculaceae bacterium]
MIAFYLIIVNLLAIALFGYDKYCARRHKWRIPEKTLIASAIIGGSAGAYLGMVAFRHKTNHKLFQICIPLLLAAQIIIFMIIY